jgi:transcription initiation factor TFIID subunit 2
MQRVPHMYTTPSPDAARCWVPCLDNLFDKCTWDFEFVVPSFLEERDEPLGILDDDLDDVDDRNRTIVVCSGDLIEQVCDDQFVGGTDILT